MRINPLIGKTLTAIYLSDDNESLKFEFTEGEPLVVGTEGDCCSYTWIENIENPEAVIGSPVLVAEDISMPEATEPSTKIEYHDSIAFYGFKISTLKGTCTIDYRNNSNGYYGGNLVWPGDYGYGYASLTRDNWVKVA